MQSHFSNLPSAKRIADASTQQKAPLLSQLTAWMTTIGESILDWLVMGRDTEPRIIQLHDREGEVFWEIYDSRTGRTIYCMTEDEVMEWLDTRYYRL